MGGKGRQRGRGWQGFRPDGVFCTLVRIIVSFGMMPATSPFFPLLLNSTPPLPDLAVKTISKTRLDYLRTSRPTAVNLGNACETLKAAVAKEACGEGSTGSSTVEAFVYAAEAMLEEDVAANRRQGAANVCNCFKCRLGLR